MLYASWLVQINLEVCHVYKLICFLTHLLCKHVYIFFMETQIKEYKLSSENEHSIKKNEESRNYFQMSCNIPPADYPGF